MERSPDDRRLNGRHTTSARGRVGNGTPVSRQPVAHSKSAKSAQASAITNGRLLPGNIDGRSAWIRRVKDLIALHIGELNGAENVSVGQQSLIRRAAVISVELERMEALWANAGHATAAELDLYSRTAGNLRRLLETLGIKRVPKDITPSVTDYLRDRHGVAS
jgi:hypothetical protein